jgi:hypothetical protein
VEAVRTLDRSRIEGRRLLIGGSWWRQLGHAQIVRARYRALTASGSDRSIRMTPTAAKPILFTRWNGPSNAHGSLSGRVACQDSADG